MRRDSKASQTLLASRWLHCTLETQTNRAATVGSFHFFSPFSSPLFHRPSLSVRTPPNWRISFLSSFCSEPAGIYFFFFSKALNGIFNTWATFTTWYYITIRHSQVHSMLACFMIHHVNVGGCRWWNGWVQLAENSRPWDNSLRGICLCISFRPEDDDRVY